MASPHLGREVQLLRPAGHHRGLGPPFSDAPPPCERCLEVAVCLEGCSKVGKGGMRKWKPEKALAAESLGAPSLQSVAARKVTQGPFPLVVAGPILAPTSETQGRRAWPAGWLGLPAGPQRSPRRASWGSAPWRAHDPPEGCRHSHVRPAPRAFFGCCIFSHVRCCLDACSV